MNIGIFTDTYYPEINGVANSTYELKKGLEKLGHKVYIFTVSNPGAYPEEGVYRTASIPFLMLRERRIGCVVSKIWKRRIRKYQLDIIHTQTEFMMGHLGRKLADWLGIPHIHTYHTIYEDYLSYLHMPDRRCFRRVARRFSRICCNHADEVIVPTRKVRDLLDTYGVRKEVHIIPSGISLDKFARPDTEHARKLKEALGIGEDDFVLLYVGRLSSEKNISELLSFVHGAADREKLRLLLVGDGPMRGELERQTRELQLEKNVIFAGMASFDEIQDYYVLGDVFVSGSTSETQGLTYIEALAAGLPLLVRQDACLGGILREYKNGISYTDNQTFQAGLEYFRKHSEQFSKKDEIKESVDELGTAAFAEQIEKLYIAVKGDAKSRSRHGRTTHAA